jgi:hypothetical protein
MPFQKRASLLAKLAVTGAALAALALPGGAAAADCTLPATAQTFAQFGDPNHYYLATGGGFEVSDAKGWSLFGSTSVIAENEPFMLAGTSDTRSVRVPAGSSVRSGKFCVTARLPHLRFVAKHAGGGDLEVRVDTYNGSELIGTAYTAVPAAEHGQWAPSRYVSLNTSGIPAGEKAHAQVTILSQGDWQVDDVFIDPYAK